MEAKGVRSGRLRVWSHSLKVLFGCTSFFELMISTSGADQTKVLNKGIWKQVCCTAKAVAYRYTGELENRTDNQLLIILCKYWIVWFLWDWPPPTESEKISRFCGVIGLPVWNFEDPNRSPPTFVGTSTSWEIWSSSLRLKSDPESGKAIRQISQKH